jgi:hypothetical protein
MLRVKGLCEFHSAKQKEQPERFHIFDNTRKDALVNRKMLISLLILSQKQKTISLNHSCNYAYLPHPIIIPIIVALISEANVPPINA